MESSAPVNNENNIKSNKSKTIFYLQIGIALIIIIAIIMILAGGKKSTTSKIVTQNEPGTHQTTAQLRNYKHEALIQISYNGPLPETLNAKVDSKIIWQNGDSKRHTIAIVSTEKVPPYFFNNRAIEANAGYSWVIHQPVTFHYYLVDSPTQTGVVIVK